MKKLLYLTFTILLGLFISMGPVQTTYAQEQVTKCTLTIDANKHTYSSPVYANDACSGFIQGYYVPESNQFGFTGIATYVVEYSGQQFTFYLPNVNGDVVLTVTTVAKKAATKPSSGSTASNNTTKSSETTKSNNATQSSETTKSNNATQSSETTKSNNATQSSETTKSNDETKNEPTSSNSVEVAKNETVEKTSQDKIEETKEEVKEDSNNDKKEESTQKISKEAKNTESDSKGNNGLLIGLGVLVIVCIVGGFIFYRYKRK